MTSIRAFRLAGPAELRPAYTPPVDPKPGQVEVRLELAGLCGSDRPGFVQGLDKHGERPAGFPTHECLGTILRAPDEPRLVGKRAIAIPVHDAGLLERFVAPVTSAYVVSGSLPDEIAILAQPLATVLAAVDRLPDPRGARGAVVGLGPIGLMFGYVLRQLGVASIDGFDRRDRTGAPLVEAFDQIGVWAAESGGYDLVVDAVGHNPAIVNECIEMSGKRGVLLAFGVPDDDVYPLRYQTFFRKNMTIVANVQPRWTTYLPAGENYLVRHRALGDLVTDVFDVADAQQAFTAAFLEDAATRGKVLLRADSWQSESI